MFGGKRVPKNQSDFKSVYVAHNPHTVSMSKRHWSDRIKIISIDPAVSHFAIRVEMRNIKTPGIITTLLYEKVGLKKEDQELSEDFVTPIYTFIQTFLDQHIELFKTCHMVIIEKQLPINYRAVRISQHVLTYFMILLKNTEPALPMFFEVAPTLKGRELGAPPNLNERGIKLWAVEKARELLTMRGDEVGMAVLDRKVNGRKEKKDDLSDTLVQAEALFSYFGWPLTQSIVELPINNNIVTLNIQPSVQKPVLTKPTLSIVTQ